MRVFVTGDTGSVGFAVATALRRAGHDVYGLTRGAAKASQLARQEIHPVQGDIGDPKSYADAAEECSVLVHAAFESSASAVAKDKGAIDALIEAGRRGARPKTLIFTSGVWVHGDTGGKLVDGSGPTGLGRAPGAAGALGYWGGLGATPLAEARRTMGDYADALALHQHVDARKAVRLLGWQPRHGGFLDEAEVFAASWKAWQSRD